MDMFVRLPPSANKYIQTELRYSKSSKDFCISGCNERHTFSEGVLQKISKRFESRTDQRRLVFFSCITRYSIYGHSMYSI